MAQRPEFNLSPNDIVIAVMGVTGSGKSTFISHFSEKQVVVGRSLESCTNTVDIFKCSTSDIGTFYLVDTPGFNDTYRSDTEILMELAAWLNAAYQSRILLTGIIYLHSVLDVRLGGKAMQNLRMFKKLCGDNYLPRVVLATTFWSLITPPELGRRREQELKSKDEYWGGMLTNGSAMFRQNNGRESGKKIIQHLVSKSSAGIPIPALDIQTEMVDNGRRLDETAAGSEMQSQLAAQKLVYQAKLAQLRRQYEQAIDSADKEWQAQLNQQRKETDLQLKKDEADRQKLQVENAKLIKRLEERGQESEQEYLRRELLVQKMNFEVQQMQKEYAAAEEKRKLEQEIEKEKNRMAKLRLQMLHASTCVIM